MQRHLVLSTEKLQKAISKLEELLLTCPQNKTLAIELATLERIRDNKYDLNIEKFTLQIS